MTLYHRDERESLLSADVVRRLHGWDAEAYFGVPFARLDGLPLAAQMMAFDFETYLPEDCLTKVDRMSMAHSIESRVPLLDHRVIEFAASLPPSHENPGRTAASTCSRSSRSGSCRASCSTGRSRDSASRSGHWFRGSLRETFGDVLGSSVTRQRAYFNQTFVGASWTNTSPARGTIRCTCGSFWSSSSGTGSTWTLPPSRRDRSAVATDSPEADVLQPARIPIALVLTSFDPGGTERQMTELMSRLDSRRFELHVACFRREGLWLARVERAAVRVTEFPIKGFLSLSMPLQLWRFVRWCREHRIAVLHACDFYANVFGLTGGALARVPVRIGSRRDLVLPGRTHGQHRLQRLTYRLAGRVVANSQAAAAQVVSEGVPASRVSMIPNGIDLARYLLPGRRLRRRVITTVANLRSEKGHEVLLAAAAIVARTFPDVELCLAGGGPMLSALERQAHDSGLAGVVRFLGHREDVPNVLADTDVFVLPSRTEAFPNVLLEAMASRLPVVASDVGGIPELVEHERNGLLVPVGDAEALAAAIRRLIEEPALADTLAAAARQTVESRYSFDRMVAAFEALYRG